MTEADNVQGCKEVAAPDRAGAPRIGCITGSERQCGDAQPARGTSGLERSGYSLDHGLIEAADFTEEGGYLAVKRPGAAARRRPSSCRTIRWPGALHALRAWAARAPGSVGRRLDGIATLRYSTPQLTTAQQPIYELGQAAARLLIEQIQGSELAERHALFPCWLRAGDTTGPPRR